MKDLLRSFMWRHYIVFWSARYAAQFTKSTKKILVECGVCDGLTAYYAMSAMGDIPFRSFLYDAWTAMKDENLVESEKNMTGDYAYLSLDNTKRNLLDFEQESIFIKGFIPDSFDTAEKPNQVSWLHIDLNSSMATTAVLAEMYDRILSGGVVLLDDYSWREYEDTKIAVDKFFSDKKGILLPLPTGQAIFFKN